MTGEVNFATGQLLGTVLAVQANFYQVQLDLGDKEEKSDENFSASPYPSMLLCTRRTRLKKLGNR